MAEAWESFGAPEESNTPTQIQTAPKAAWEDFGAPDKASGVQGDPIVVTARRPGQPRLSEAERQGFIDDPDQTQDEVTTAPVSYVKDPTKAGRADLINRMLRGGVSDDRIRAAVAKMGVAEGLPLNLDGPDGLLAYRRNHPDYRGNYDTSGLELSHQETGKAQRLYDALVDSPAGAAVVSTADAATMGKVLPRKGTDIVEADNPKTAMAGELAGNALAAGALDNVLGLAKVPAFLSGVPVRGLAVDAGLGGIQGAVEDQEHPIEAGLKDALGNLIVGGAMRGLHGTLTEPLPERLRESPAAEAPVRATVEGPAASPEPTRDQRVAERAYQKFQESGGEHGNDDKHWNDAAAEIDREDANAEAEKADADHHQALKTHVEQVASNWKNAPDIHVINGLDDIQDPTVRKQIKDEGGHDAYGFYGSDGKVYINAQNVHSTAEATGVLYHETLGHHGLAQQFGDGLDGILRNVYDTNEKYRGLTDQWIADNPTGYKGPSQVERALEEVLAQESEKGDIAPTIRGRITNFVKTMGRRAGIRLKYTDNDINHILAMAHDRVINGTGRATPEGVNRFMYGGFSSEKADWNDFIDAADAEREGQNPVDIYRDTGIFRGPDDHQRFEFSDKDAKFKPEFESMYERDENGRSVPLDEAIDHPELFEHYPSLKNTKIQWDKFGGEKGLYGSYDKYENVIRLNPEADFPEKDMGLSTTLHEIQHNIQDVEGWSQGGNTGTAIHRLSDDQFRTFKKKILDDLQTEHDKRGAVAVLADKLEKSPKFKPLFDDYWKASDHVEVMKEEDPDFQLDFDKKSHRDAYDARTIAERKMADFIFGEGKHVSDVKDQRVKDIWYALRDWGPYAFEDIRDNARKSQGEIEDKGRKVYDADRQGIIDLTDLSHAGDHFKAYQNLFGEIEARDTQARQHMTDAERRETLPYSSANDVATEDVIAQNRGGTSRYSRPKSAEQIAREQQERDDLRAKGKDDAERIVEGLYGRDDLPELIRRLGTSSKNTPQSFQDIEYRARQMGMSPSDVIRNAGARGLSEAGARIHAMETVQKRVLGRVTDILDRLDPASTSFDPSDKIALSREVMNLTAVHTAVEGRIADAGRLLNSLKILKDDRLQMTAMMDALKEIGGPEAHLMDDETFSRFAKALKQQSAQGNTQGVANVMTSVSKPYWWQYPLSLRHNLMLSGLGTHVKNTYDNLTMIAREMEETTVALAAAPVRAGLRKAGVNVQDGVSPEEVVGRAYGLMRAAIDSMQPMKVGTKGPIVGTGGALREAAYAFRKGHTGANSKLSVASSLPSVPDARIPVIGKVGDFLHAQDQFFRAFLNNANMYSLGIREARANGLKGRAAFNDGVQRALNPSVEMIARSNDLSNIALLVDKPFLQGLENLKAIKPNMTPTEQAKAAGANVLFPFFRVTDRLIAQKIRRSPLSFMDRVTREDFAAGGARRDIAIARTAMGSALIYYYWQQAGLKKTTPAGDYQKNESLRNGGYQPNSVDDGDRYTDATALNLSINPRDLHNAVAVNVATIRAAYEKNKDAESASAGIYRIGKAVMTQLAKDSFVSGLNEYTSAFMAEGPTADAKAGNLLGSVAGSFVVPALSRQINSVYLDKIRRDTRGDGGFLDTAKGRILSGLPTKYGSESLPIRYDAYGRPEVQGKSLSGIYNYQNKPTDPVIKAVEAVELGQDNPVIGGASKNVRINGKQTKLTGQVYSEYTRLAGEQFYNTIKPYTESPGWAAMSQDDKAKLIKKAMTNSRKAARTSMFGGPE